MTNFVQQYRSTDASAPVLTGEAGKLIALLDAVLKDGYSTASISSITRSGTTATATLAVANTTLVTGNYWTVAGANETDYNVTAQITVNSSTSISYQVANSPATPATGTLTYKKAGLGWTKPFNGTNLAVWLPQSVSGYPQFYLRMDETGGTAGGQKEAAVRGFESMSDVNTGTNGFPTAAQQTNGLCWRKSTTADSTARAWTVIGDGRFFYLVMNSDASNTLGRNLQAFGGFLSYKSGDAYNALLSGTSAFNATGQSLAAGGLGSAYVQNGVVNQTGIYLARSSSQAGGSLAASHRSAGPIAGNFTLGGAQASGMTYPNPADGTLRVHVCEIMDSATAARGRAPGLYNHDHSSIPINEYDKATNVTDLSGVTLTGLTVTTTSGQGLALIDTFGPW